MKADKILFLGNSITLTPGPQPAIGWEGNWGMAASAESKDYVHVLTTSIAALAGGTPAIMVSNVADAFERSYSNAGYDVQAALASQLAFQADIVVVQIGENMAALNSDADKALFTDRFGQLLAALKSSSQPEIFVTGGIIDGNKAAKDEIKEQLCGTMGCVYVGMSAFSQNPLNYAYSDTWQTFSQLAIDSGVTVHPGDTGMNAIATTLLKAMVPEPGSWMLLGTGALALLAWAWRKRK